MLNVTEGKKWAITKSYWLYLQTCSPSEIKKRTSLNCMFYLTTPEKLKKHHIVHCHDHKKVFLYNFWSIKLIKITALYFEGTLIVFHFETEKGVIDSHKVVIDCKICNSFSANLIQLKTSSRKVLLSFFWWILQTIILNVHFSFQFWNFSDCFSPIR